jgi:hypothetical protein
MYVCQCPARLIHLPHAPASSIIRIAVLCREANRFLIGLAAIGFLKILVRYFFQLIHCCAMAPHPPLKGGPGGYPPDRKNKSTGLGRSSPESVVPSVRESPVSSFLQGSPLVPRRPGRVHGLAKRILGCSWGAL